MVLTEQHARGLVVFGGRGGGLARIDQKVNPVLESYLVQNAVQRIDFLKFHLCLPVCTFCFQIFCIMCKEIKGGKTENFENVNTKNT